MNVKIANQWIRALRSGKYKQGAIGQLKDDNGGYCCLGVLCELAVKAGVCNHTSDSGYNKEKEVLPFSVRLWAGLSNALPFVPGFISQGTQATLASLNDGVLSGRALKRRATFDEIADVIEQVKKELV